MRGNEKEILPVLAARVAEFLKHKSKCKDFDISLLGGDFGSICFLYEYGKYNAAFEQTAEIFLEQSLRTLSRYARIGTYCNGLAGFATGLLFLEEDKLIEDASIAISSLDPAISLCLKRQLESNDIDFLHGIIGYGFYFLERLKSNQVFATQELTDIINHLHNVKHEIDDSIAWELPKPEHSNKYNISLSHGMSSIIILLSRLTLEAELPKPLRDKAKGLLSKSVRFVVSQQLNHNNFKLPNMFPSTWRWCDDKPLYSRMAWCYGDLGVAVGLISASKALEDISLLELARDIAVNSASRQTFADTTIYDDCICHGIAGVSLVTDFFSRIFDDEKILKAATYWHNKLTTHFNESGTICYKYYDTTDKEFKLKYGLLEGLSGVGLSLLPDKHFINKLLLLS